MMTKDFKVEKLPNGRGTIVVQVAGAEAPPHLKNLRIPPAWTEVVVNDDASSHVLAMGTDSVGRRIRIYSPSHIAGASSDKFERVAALRAEWEDIRSQMEGDLSSGRGRDGYEVDKEAALVAYLIYETAIRPGSDNDTGAQVQAYGATTLQLRHIKPCARGMRLQFVGKKGVRQNVLVTNPFLVEELIRRKQASTSWSFRVFDCPVSRLRAYVRTLGSGQYRPKDFRTGRATVLALELLGKRRRLPKAKAKVKALINEVLDSVAGKLGNTRAISRKSYVDPSILERFLAGNAPTGE